MDGMFNSALFKNIIKKNNLDDLSIFLRAYDSYEEIPVIARYSDVLFTNNYISKNELSSFLLNIAIFYVNNIKLYAKRNLTSQDFSTFFVCITYYHMENEVQDAECVIPNLFVTRKVDTVSFLQSDMSTSIEDFPALNVAFNNCNALNSFKFYKVSTKDNYGIITRVYAVPYNSPAAD